MKLRTPEEVRAELAYQGVSITQWALARGLSPQLTTEVLRDWPRRGQHGKSHEIAVALGLKAGAICVDPAKALSKARVGA